MEFTASYFPAEYVCWVEIVKPSHWSFYSIVDSYEAEKISYCLGTDYGSTKLIIKNTDLIPGKWKLKALSTNYITIGNIGIWNSNEFINGNKLTYGDVFQLNIT